MKRTYWPALLLNSWRQSFADAFQISEFRINGLQARVSGSVISRCL